MFRDDSEDVGAFLGDRGDEMGDVTPALLDDLGCRGVGVLGKLEVK
jgi:hypothetical protein